MNANQSQESIIREALHMALESTAQWRTWKAEEYPDDARNSEAAHQLQKLAASVAELEDDEYPLPRLAALYERLDDEGGEKASAIESELLRQVGFYTSYDNSKALLGALCKELDQLVPRVRSDLH